MEQFNPGLRNLINLGKNYERAVNGKFSRCYLERMFNFHLNIHIEYEGCIYRLNSLAGLWMCLIKRGKNPK